MAIKRGSFMVIKQGDEVLRKGESEIGVVRHIIEGVALVKYKERRKKVPLEDLIKYERPVIKRVTSEDYDAAIEAYKMSLIIEAGPRPDLKDFLDVIGEIAQGIKKQLFKEEK